MAIERDNDDAVTPGPSAAPDLDAWRADAGECAPLAAGATAAPWRVSTQLHDERPHTEEVCDLVNNTWVVTDYQLSHYRDDAAFIAAARTGWPRDASRVVALCARVDALEATIAAWREHAAAELDSSSFGGSIEARCAAQRKIDDAWREINRVDPDWEKAVQSATAPKDPTR